MTTKATAPATKWGPKRWPHKSVLVDITDAARLLGVNRTTLAKPVFRLGRDPGGDPGTKIAAVALAAALFAAAGKGVSVSAGDLARKVGKTALLDLNPPPPPKPKERRLRIGEKEKARLPTMTEKSLALEFQNWHNMWIWKANKNAGRRLAAIRDVMRDSGYPFPAAMIGKTLTADFQAFRTLGDWLERAEPGDYRLFVFVRGHGRPIDYPLARKGDLRLKTTRYRFLTIGDWIGEIETAIREEEEAKIANAAEEAKAPNKDRRLRNTPRSARE